MYKTIKGRIHIVVILVFFLCPAVFAQQYQPGEILKAKVNLYLRNTPPSGIFNAMTPEIGVLRAGDTVRVIEADERRTLFSTFKWIKIEKVNPPSRPEDTPGVRYFWVLAEQAGEPPYFEREG